MSKRRNKRQKLVVLQTAIIRRERDAEKLLAGLAAGDITCRKFHEGLGQWLMWLVQDQPPPCLTCKHEFRGKAPSTFMMAYSEDPRHHVILMGVCDTCATKSETELLSVWAAGICRVLDGRILGFDSPTTTSIN